MSAWQPDRLLPDFEAWSPSRRATSVAWLAARIKSAIHAGDYPNVLPLQGGSHALRSFRNANGAAAGSLSHVVSVGSGDDGSAQYRGSYFRVRSAGRIL